MCLTPCTPLTIRVYSDDGSWPSLFANEGGGQNRQSVLTKKRRNNSRKMQQQKLETIAVLDRCGNNWKNGKGGCGILVNKEYAPCLATMFQPFIVVLDKVGGKET